MNFARWTFRLSAIYGLIVLFPLYFLEHQIAVSTPPAITHPEYFYGFIGSACIMQLVYFLVSTDPRRYLALMPISATAKLLFFASNLLLASRGRLSGAPLYMSFVDMLWGILFLISFLKARKA